MEQVLKSRECGKFDERVEKLAEFLAKHVGGAAISLVDFSWYLIQHLDKQCNANYAGIKVKLDLDENGNISNYLSPMAVDECIPKNEIHLVVVDKNGVSDTLILRNESNIK